jgi:hypothetical protein
MGLLSRPDFFNKRLSAGHYDALKTQILQKAIRKSGESDQKSAYDTLRNNADRPVVVRKE